MKFSETIRLVFINIIQNKLKVILTSLGIIAGAATVVAVIAIGRGGEEEVRAQFSGLSAETIYVNPNYMQSINLGMENIPKLTVEQMEFMMGESTALTGMYMRGNTFTEVTVNGKKENMSVAGVTQDYSNVSNLNLVYGNNIDQIDVEDGTSVAVIGDSLVNKYFMGPEDAVGKQIRIGNRSYLIIGVLERTGDGMQGLSPDDTIFIPYSTAQQYVFDEYVIPQMVSMAENIDVVDLAMAEIKDSLDYLLEDGSVYMVEDAGSRIEAASESSNTMNMLLVSIATIVFIVGGIGIMNVLFLSVKERTKEIGILKAIGSSKTSIMSLFLLESIIISGFGGLIGVMLSYYFIPVIKYMGIPASSSVDGMVIALMFALGTGTVFGIFPAYKAAQLKPIDALTYE
ncbi:MAG: ABC transporter permease [Turicibacter sp.]